MKFIKLMLILVLLAGVSLFAYSFTLPYYNSEDAKLKLDVDMANKLDKVKSDAIKDNYYKQVDEIKTDKTTYMDLGSGLAISSTVLLLFLFYKRIRRFNDLRSLGTLSKPAIFITCNLFGMMLVPGTVWYYTFRGDRGDYPWFSDSISIPILYQIVVIAVGMVVLNLFLFFISFKSAFPALIFVKQEYEAKKNIIWDVFWGALLLMHLILFVILVVDGDHFAIPICIFFTYILLNLRAGQINRYQQENQYDYPTT